MTIENKRKWFVLFLFTFLAVSRAAFAGDTRVGHYDEVDLQSGVYNSVLKAGSLSGNTAFTLPTSNGTSGQFLSTNGSGTLSWLSGIPGSVMTTLGDMLYEDATPTPVRLPGNTTTTTKYLQQVGTGVISAAPSWSQVSLTAGVTGTLPVANGGTGVTTSTGTGNTVLSTSPTLTSAVLVTPALGTPTSGVATNLTGLPLTTGVTGTLPVANGGTGVTSSTGSGSNVLNTSPTLVTPLLGTPTSGVATNLTGLPLSTGVTGTLALLNGGTGTAAASANAAFNALSPLTTKGDLVSYSTVNARLPVGTDAQVLTADSAQTLGVKWATPTTGTVTSVAMSVPSLLSVSGSPVTSSGTLAVTYSGTPLPLANGGTAATTKAGAFDSLSPMTTAGDTVYGGTAGTGTRLAAGSSTQLLHSGTVPSWSAVSLTADVSGTLPVANGGTGVTSSTGTGSVVLSTSPTLVTPALGTPSALVGTNITNLPLSTAVAGTLAVNHGGTGQTTTTTAFDALAPTSTKGDLIVYNGSATNTRQAVGSNNTVLHADSAQTTGLAWSSVLLTADVSGTLPVANGGTGVTTSTGSGNNVLSTSPTLVTPVLGTPTSVTLTNGTGLPLTTGVTGTLPIANGGTGQTTALPAYDALAAGATGTPTKGDLLSYGTTSTVRVPAGTNGQVLSSDSTQTGGIKWIAAGGTGTVTSVALTAPAIFSVSGSPVTTSGTLALTATGTSGGVPYFDSTTTLASSALLTNNAVMLGGGAGAAPKSLALGTANQVLGMNSGATANEYKTLSVGTSGSDFAIANAANSVTFNLPDASASNRGVVTTGTQTFAGAKTFSSALTVSAGINGVSDNSTAAAGIVGEFKENCATSGVSLTSGDNTVIDSGGGSPTGIALTAGTWDVTGTLQYVPNTTTSSTFFQGFVSTSTANNSTGRDVQRNFIEVGFASGGTVIGNINYGVSLPTWRVNLSGSQTYYLKIAPSFTVSTATATGCIRATRAR